MVYANDRKKAFELPRNACEITLVYTLLRAYNAYYNIAYNILYIIILQYYTVQIHDFCM